MILIVGSSHDDVLYFETLLSQKHSEVLFDKYPVVFGRLFNQDIAVVSEVYTNYLSSLITSYFINKYYIMLVINVGTCTGYSDNVMFGDIIVSRQTMLADVNQVNVRPVSLGQIPNGYPIFYRVQQDILSLVIAALDTRTVSRYSEGVFFSSNTFFSRDSQIDPLLVDGQLTSIEDSVVFDCTFGGVVLSCYVHKVACIAVKVVECKYGERLDYLNYSKILDVYSNVGRVIASTIGDIGRTDILEEA